MWRDWSSRGVRGFRSGSYVFFFFQAEDGIRDIGVTGVQTCALPIFPERGIGYRWEERLGGRRRLPAGEPVADGWWTVAQFAAYAAHTRTPEFAVALGQVLDAARERRVAVLCSEFVWWRCHRRLIADVVVLSRGLPVDHLMPDGRLTPHRPAEGAVLSADGSVRWPG